MAGLEDIVPQIVIDTSQGEEALKHLAEVGAEAFAEIVKAAAAGDFTALATMVGGKVAGAFVEATQSVLEFVDACASAVETLSNLASATGMSLPALEGLKDAFASVGVSTQGFERSIGRLAQTIGNDWAEIQKSVRTSGDDQEKSMQGIRDAADNTEKAYKRLQKVGEDAAVASAHDALGIREAQQALEQAQQKQKEHSPFNNPDDAGAKKARQDAADQLSVDKAKQGVSDANRKKIDDEVKAQDQLKEAVKNIAKAQLQQREEAEKAHESDLKDIPKIAAEIGNVVTGMKKWDEVTNHAEISAKHLTEAIILSASAGTKEVPSVKAVYGEIASLFEHMGNSAEESSKKIEIVQHALGAGFRSGQASAAQIVTILGRGKDELEKFQKEAEAFSKTKIGLDVSNHDDKGAQKDPLKADDVDKIKKYQAAWSELDAVIENVKEHMAAMMSSDLAKMFDGIKNSITDTDGALYAIISAVEEFGSSCKSIFNAINDEVKAVFGADIFDIWKADLKGIAIVADLIAAAFHGIAAAMYGIAALIKAGKGDMAGFAESSANAAKELKAAYASEQAAAKVASGQGDGTGRTSKDREAQEAKDKAKGGSGASDKAAQKTEQAADKTAAAADKTGQAADKSNDGASKMSDAATAISNNAGWAADKLNSAASALTSAAAALRNSVGSAPGKAAGGMIRGPGGPRSDTAGVFALSDGEFVMQQAAVQHYGADFMSGLNSLAVGGFAVGGLVGKPGYSAGPGTGGPSSILNLTIDGNHFDGLRAPENTAAKLKTYAVGRQSSSAGRMPSWVG